jgi:hypothetical protein
MMITYRLIERLEELSERSSESVRILNKARATRLLTSPSGAVVGVEYEKGGAVFTAHGPVSAAVQLSVRARCDGVIATISASLSCR